MALQASTIISMVPTGKHVRDVYIDGEKSVLNALKTLTEEQRAATLCMDQSTIEQSTSKQVALTLREAGAQFLDAPVSGGDCTPPPPPHCWNRALTFDFQALWELRREHSPSWWEVTRRHSTAQYLYLAPCLARSHTVVISELDSRPRLLTSKLRDVPP